MHRAKLWRGVVIYSRNICSPHGYSLSHADIDSTAGPYYTVLARSIIHSDMSAAKRLAA